MFMAVVIYFKKSISLDKILSKFNNKRFTCHVNYKYSIILIIFCKHLFKLNCYISATM